MKKLPILAFIFFFMLCGIQLRAQSYGGYWVTPAFTPISTGNGVAEHQKMLMRIQSMEGSTTAYRLYYYVWNKDFARVVGPNFENGVLDANTGWIYLTRNKQGRDIIKLENGHLFYFLTNNPAANAKTTILNMTPVDDKTGLQLEAIIRKKMK